MAPKSYNILVVPDDHSGTRQYRIRRPLLVSGLVLAGLLVVVLLVFVATYGRVLRQAQKVHGLQQENAELREQLAKVDELSRELEAMTALRAQVVKMLGSTEIEVPELNALTGSAEGERILEDSEHLQQLFAEAARKPFAPTLWPVEGRVRREFIPRSEAGEPAHPGLDLEVRDGGPVRAAGRGHVVDVGFEEGLGHYVVLDHGYGFRTRYAGLDRVFVPAGEALDRGQVLGEIDPAGPRTDGRRIRPGRLDGKILYFELRVDGTPVDPRRYLEPR